MTRLFVALDLPEFVKTRLAELCAFGLPGVSWVPPVQLHLSLRFIGEVDATMVGMIQTALLKVRAGSFPLKLHGMGTFPPGKIPRVVWVGVEKNEPLIQLQHKIEYQLTQAGLPGERRKFHPHVTLGRAHSPKLPRLQDYLAAHNLFKTEAFDVSEFSLYSSLLKPSGAIHTKETTYPLS